MESNPSIPSAGKFAAYQSQAVSLVLSTSKSIGQPSEIQASIIAQTQRNAAS
jgi:hypothetical protein